MGTFDNTNFSDRIKTSNASKSALVEKLKARPGPTDPRLIAKAAERKIIHEARLARLAEKERLQQEQRAHEAEMRRLHQAELADAALAREAELEVERQAAETAKLERATRVISDLAEQKATRDARYAARKARQK